MKKWVRILLSVLCGMIIAAIPFVISSPLYNAEEEWDEDADDYSDEVYDDETYDEEEYGGKTGFFLLDFLFTSAKAEENSESNDDIEVEEAEITNGFIEVQDEWKLPLDEFVTPPNPNPSGFTENGYEDETVSVKIEKRTGDKVEWIIAYIKVADPSQLRTAFSKKNARVSSMAKANHAVIAISGDYCMNDKQKTTFEVRMGQIIRRGGNGAKDMLVIDDKGDFHLFQKSVGLFEKNSKNKWVYIYEEPVVNAFTFGPALVIDGELQQTDEHYGYNPNHKEPRAAIGQIDTLNYVFVLAASSDRDGKTGVTHQELANMMYEIGCRQAFNLDGGGTAEIWFHDEIFRASPGSNERDQSDMIYIATLVPDGD